MISGKRYGWKDRIWPNHTDFKIVVSSLTSEHWQCFEDFNRESIDLGVQKPILRYYVPNKMEEAGVVGRIKGRLRR